MRLPFTKMQGTGNDFIVVDLTEGDRPVNWSLLVPRLCDRHYGIGADGLVLVLPSEQADFRMRILNADGSEPEMCGNGLRCFAYYVHNYGLTDQLSMTVETGAGVLTAELLVDDDHPTAVRIDMGAPRLARDSIPMQGEPTDRVVLERLSVGDRHFDVTAVSMGNPHAVTFLEDLADSSFEGYGPQIEAHAAFPQRANAEFVQVLARDHLRVKVWERGVGPTLACGTGACAALVAGVLTDRTDRRALVELPGGTLEVVWEEGGHVLMTGPAEVVFTGVIDLPAVPLEG